MSLLDWDYDELAYRVQTGLDRVSVSFFRHHGARVRRDEVDFHGYEHVELEVAHGGHRLHVRQYARAHGPEAAATTVGRTEPYPTEEFVSTFDGQPARQVPLDRLVAWLRELPVGEARTAAVEPSALDPDNPFLPPPRRSGPGPTPLAHNPFLPERPADSTPNPFAPPPADEQRRRALDWLRDDD